MSVLPRVTESVRERVSREFDDLGPGTCVTEVHRELERSNPVILEMAARCARDTRQPDDVLMVFSMFYRLLVVAAAIEYGTAAPSALAGRSQLPRVSEDTRTLILKQIDALGAEAFTIKHIEHLEQDNPELLTMAHAFAARHADYLLVMQGIALLWASLTLQNKLDRSAYH